MLLLSPLIGLMPQATLAAVVIVYSVGLIQPAEFRDILRIRRTEFVWAIAAFAGVMLVGTLKGILVAIIVSLVALGHQTANPPVYVLGRKPGTNVFRPRSDEHPDDEFFPGLLLLRLEGRLFFVNAERVGDKIRPLIGRREAERRRAGHERRVRSGVFGAEGADRGRAAAARSWHYCVAVRVSTPTSSQWCGDRRSAMRSETNECSSIWKWPSIRFGRWRSKRTR